MSDENPYGTPPSEPDSPKPGESSPAEPPQSPPPAPASQPTPDVPDYMVWSIVLTGLASFCCVSILSLPFGIAGIVFSARSNNKKTRGDFEGALNDSAMAKKMCIFGGIAIGVGIALSVLLAIAIVIGSSTSP